MLDTINIYNCSTDGERPTRMVPIFGALSNAPDVVLKTPMFHLFPLIGGDLMAAITFTTIQQLPVSIQPVNDKGKPAPVDGAPVWLTDNTDVVALTPSADGLSCVIVAVGIPGTATVQVTADADLGTGVTNLIGTIEVEVVAAPATSIVVTPGTPEVQP